MDKHWQHWDALRVVFFMFSNVHHIFVWLSCGFTTSTCTSSILYILRTRGRIMNTSSLPEASCFFAKTRFQTRKTARILDFLSVCRLGVECLWTATCTIDSLGTWKELKWNKEAHNRTPSKRSEGIQTCTEKSQNAFFAKEMVYLSKDLFSEDLVTFPESLALNFVYPNPSDSTISASLMCNPSRCMACPCRVVWSVDPCRLEMCRKLEVGLVDAQLLLKRLGHSALPRLVLSEHRKHLIEARKMRTFEYIWLRCKNDPNKKKVYDYLRLYFHFTCWNWIIADTFRHSRRFTSPRHFSNSHGEHTQLCHDVHLRVLLLAPTECWLVAGSFTNVQDRVWKISPTHMAYGNYTYSNAATNPLPLLSTKAWRQFLSTHNQCTHVLNYQGCMEWSIRVSHLKDFYTVHCESSQKHPNPSRSTPPVRSAMM